jgi:hypothetical protein
MSKYDSFDFVSHVLSRLEERKELGYKTFEHVEWNGSDVVFENEVTTYCIGNPSGRYNFDCSMYSCPASPVPGKPYNCPSQFECISPNQYNEACIPQAGSSYYDCTQAFDCMKDSPTTVVYGCNYFKCTSNYNCDVLGDFSCPGAAFRCGESKEKVTSGTFECSAGHIFVCTAKHVCEDTFNCKAGGKKDWDCNGELDSGRYNLTPIGEDNVAGDFGCGYKNTVQGAPAIPDFFDCKNFECRATDDFFCLPTTNFYCGHETSGSFACASQTATNEFKCRNNYTCAIAEQVNCGEANYTCPNSYAVCPTLSTKECLKQYICPHNTAMKTLHSCLPANFNCETSNIPQTYDCSKSIPPYSNTGG